jgi:peroxiredoxin
VRRRPRKAFLLLGTVLAAGLAAGLFAGVGTDPGSGRNPGGSAHAPVGDRAPDFTLQRLDGSGTVGTPGSGGGHGTPAVLLFFGNWCAECHTELPKLAAAVDAQQQRGGKLARVAVIGVDNFDRSADAVAFTRASGVTFPVAFDPAAKVTSELYGFPGDPVAVFIDGRGTIAAVRFGPLSAAELTRLEQRLVA